MFHVGKINLLVRPLDLYYVVPYLPSICPPYAGECSSLLSCTYKLLRNTFSDSERERCSFLKHWGTGNSLNNSTSFLIHLSRKSFYYYYYFNFVNSLLNFPLECTSILCNKTTITNYKYNVVFRFWPHVHFCLW